MNTSLFDEETVKEKLQQQLGALEAAEEAIPRLANVVGAECKEKDSLFLHSERIRGPTGHHKNGKILL